MMLRRLPSFGACQLSGHQSIARSLGAVNNTGLFHVQCGISRSLASRALKPVVRDPERPVRPATPWLSFLQEYRKGHPSGGKETMAAASKEWKAMPDGQKKQFIEPYEAQKTIYEEKMKAYVESGKKDAWGRDPERPKAPMSGYMRFAQDFRQRNPSLKVTEASKSAAASWKTLKAEEKQRYDDAYKAEKEKYSKDMKAYKDSGKEDAWKAKVGITAQEEKEAQKKAKALEKTKTIKAKEKQKKAKALEKAKTIKAKEKEKKEKEKEKVKKDKAKQDEKAAQLQEKEKAKKAKAKLAAEEAKIKEKAKAAREKLKAKSAGTSKQARA